MPKIQPCRNGCGTEIFVKEDVDHKFKPYDARTEQLHDCPNSEYNKKKQQGEAYRTPKENVTSDIEQRILSLLETLNDKVDSIISGRSFIEPEEPEE